MRDMISNRPSSLGNEPKRDSYVNQQLSRLESLVCALEKATDEIVGKTRSVCRNFPVSPPCVKDEGTGVALSDALLGYNGRLEVVNNLLCSVLESIEL